MAMLRAFLLLMAVMQLTGCAFGQRVDYTQSVPTLALNSDKTIAVSVVDERPYVLSGGKERNYVGTVRGGYYNPFNMNTYSGLPLATDLQKAVIAGLRKASVNAQDQNYPGSKAEDASQRLLVLRIKQWKSDTYMRARFDYDLTASVYNEQGEQLMTQDATWSGQITDYLEGGRQALGTVLSGAKLNAALSTSSQLPVATTKAPPMGTATSPGYDQCMRRVLRISDPALRLRSMPACDQVK
ncbi:MAG: hypothetical protein ABWY06_05230 [Pseudomonas sp.]|uniref:hypothetical protein n=1 Tax=Pseudomonas sp. TaxID=306 RepID=UPI0033983EC5